jgi:formamidopyrimidine-DNA glycosylase
MPELPEVETVRKTLEQLVSGKTIRQVDVRLPRLIKRPDDAALFASLLEGRTILGVGRRGKFLRIFLDGWTLVSHLRMEGRYGLYQAEDPVEKHTHVIFRFSDGTELRYKDVRQFGTIHLFEQGKDLIEPPLDKLGLEPLDPAFTRKAFSEAIAGRSTRIKPLLLDQRHIAGLGNIYVDEALHRAGIHPERTADSLSAKEMKKLHEAIVAVLGEAVEAGGSSVKSYVNGQGEMGMFQLRLMAYGRNGEPCRQCGTAIVKTVVGGRGTHYCPACQKPKRRRRP